MRRFARLFEAIDSTTSTNAKVDAMAAYFTDAAPAEAAWILFYLSGRKAKRIVSASALAQWLVADLGLPDWLFRESYAAVGDLAETIALVTEAMDWTGTVPAVGTSRLDDGRTVAGPAFEDLSVLMDEWLLPLRDAGEAERRTKVLAAIASVSGTERFLLVKLITGALRVGVSQSLVVRAMARSAGVDPAEMAHRITGDWKPTADQFRRFLTGDGGSRGADIAGIAGGAMRPSPFFLASPLTEDPESLGDPDRWQVEWKWDGIRAQLVRREHGVLLWSRGDEDLTARFPEITDAASRLPPGTVIDGEVLCWEPDPSTPRGGRPLPFARLQTRIGRTSLSRRVLAQAPAAMIAYDLLEDGGVDIRERPMSERRDRLVRLLGDFARGTSASRLRCGEVLEIRSWAHAASLRLESRSLGVEGLMLKARSSAYGVGRTRGDWWKWKIDPLVFDGVMVYAEPGHGRRANLLTDYTFAVWSDGDEPRTLLPVTRAYSGLDQAEITELDSWIRSHTTERFGPVRHVEPTMVFEIAFEGIAESTRHKSGLALRFPRIARWRRDKPAAEADTVASLRRLARAMMRDDGPPSGRQELLFE